MSKIGTFNRASAQAIQEKIDEIFAPHKDRLLEEFGVAIKTGHGTFYDKRFDLKIEIAVVGESGVAASKTSENFDRYRDQIGWSGKVIVAAFDLGMACPFQHNRKSWFVEGWRPRARKFPFVIAQVNNPSERVCVGESYLITLIERAADSDAKIKAALGDALKPADDGATEASPGDLIKTQKRSNG